MATSAGVQDAAAAGRTTRARPTRVGVVSSDVRDKTITVVVEYSAKHSKYGKYIRRSTKFQVHDEKNEAGVGDRVEITECRPLSKTKCWRLLRVLNRAPRGAAT